MKHFYKNIQGWSKGIDGLYLHIVQQSKDGMHFVEVGSWKGKSAAFMAVEIANSGKNIKFDCIDTWKGSEEHKDEDVILTDTLYEMFQKNMETVSKYYTPIRLDSVNAAKTYKDNSLDFVFIDAAHDYESVKQDIAVWLPKVKVGGILAGHDMNWTSVKQAVVETLPNVERFNKQCWLTVKT